MDTTLELLFTTGFIKWSLWVVIIVWGIYLVQRCYIKIKNSNYYQCISFYKIQLLFFIAVFSFMIYGSIAETAYRPKTELHHTDIFINKTSIIDSKILPEKVLPETDTTTWEALKEQNRKENQNMKETFLQDK